MGFQRRLQEGLDQAIGVLRWVSSSLADDDDVQAHVDNAAGGENASADPAEVWTVAGVQSRPRAGSEADGYAHALTVQLGDATIILATHDPRHVEACAEGELVIHALGKDGALRALVRLKPDGSIDVSGTNVIIGNPDGTLEPIALGDAITNHFSAVKTWMDTHIHTTTATVSTGPVGVIAAPSPASPSVPATLGSSKHSVET